LYKKPGVVTPGFFISIFLRLQQALSLLLLAQKEAKKAPAIEYSPMAGSSSVHHLCYCEFNSCFSMLRRDRKSFAKLTKPL